MAAPREDKLSQGRQRVVQLGNGGIQRRETPGAQQRLAGKAEAAAKIEEVLLNVSQQRLNPVGWRPKRPIRSQIGQQQTYPAVEFVNVSHDLNPRMVFRKTAAVGKAGLSLVPCSGHDAGESVGHVGILPPLA
jgi:hypothetical protein